MKKLLVVSDPAEWHIHVPDVAAVSAKEYLTSPDFIELRGARVFNLCGDYRYQSAGYYVSLLAEARGHKPVPSVTTLQDMRTQFLLRSVADDLDVLIQRSFAPIRSREFILSIYFGRNVARRYDRLAKQLSNLFQAPLIQARFTRGSKEKWLLQSVRPIDAGEIPASHRELVAEFAAAYFGRRRFPSGKKPVAAYDVAILVNPDEKEPPSDSAAIERFVAAGERAGFDVELITRDDYSRVGEFDALFIRETTAVNHHTYRFARRAAAEGVAVIDDPQSILRCTNKVYLAELFAKSRVPSPPTIIIHEGNRRAVGEMLGFPMVLKRPDSSFSQGVVKVEDEKALRRELGKMLSSSDLVIAQKFTPSAFDWRIGILDRQPLFACKYFMARGHWQIYNWAEAGEHQAGAWETVPVTEAPPAIVSAAVRAAGLIGDGLYGVDVKDIDGRASVIEVNDNPSVESEVEDAALGDALYDAVMLSLRRRIERRHGTAPSGRQEPAPPA